MPEELPATTTPAIQAPDSRPDHILVNQDEHGKNLAALGEHHLVEQGNTTNAVKGLEPVLEHSLTVQGEILDAIKAAPSSSIEDGGQITIKGVHGDKGEQGDPGKALTWDMLTPEQKNEIQGELGPPGLTGPPGRAGVDGRPGVAGSRGKPGQDGQPGKDGEAGKPGKKGRDGRDGSPDTADQIIDKIRGLLSYDDLTDAPDVVAIIRQHVASRDYDLAELKDVDSTGVVPGQSIQWDGERWIPYTPSGSSGTAVYNEVVDGSGTSFTLADVPTAGSVRLYAEGQRLVPPTDYTISGASITATDSWPAGALTADYNH